MRTYKSQSGFKGQDPFVFPKTKKFKAVVTDKGTFPDLPKTGKVKRGDEVITEEDE